MPPGKRGPRMVALDLDGTLVKGGRNGPGAGNRDEVSAATLRALRSFKAEGGIVTIATGRGKANCLSLAEELWPLVDYCVVNDGLAIWAPILGAGPGNRWTEIFTLPLANGETMGAVIHTAHKVLPGGVSFGLTTPHGQLVSDERYISQLEQYDPDWAVKARRENLFRPGTASARQVPATLDEYVTVVRQHGGGVYLRIMPATPLQADGMINRLVAVLSPMLQDEMKISKSVVKLPNGTESVIVRSRAIDKAAALAELCRRLGINSSEVTAFGNDLNDLGMFRWAGHSVCPANGVQDAKDQAAEVSNLTNDQDFIGVWLAERLAASKL